MVFHFTFSGTIYYCAVRSGERGWILVDYDADLSTVINTALTTVATGEIIFVMAGAYTASATILYQRGCIVEAERGAVITAGAGVSPLIDFNDQNDCILKNLELVGNEENDSVLVDMGTGQHCEVHGIVASLTECCVYTDGGDYGLINNCRLTALNYGGASTYPLPRNIVLTNATYMTVTLCKFFGLAQMSLYQNCFHNITSECKFVPGAYVGICHYIEQDCSYNILDSCTFEGDGTTALQQATGIGDADHPSTHNIMSNNTIYNFEASALDINTGHHNTVTGNTVKACQYGIAFDTAPDNIADGNIITDSDTSGIKTNVSPRCIISNNIVFNNGLGDDKEHGIFIIGGSHDTVIDGNVVQQNWWHCLVVAESDRVVVSENKVRDSDTDGIQLYNGCNHCLVIGNMCNNNGGFGISLTTNCDNNFVTANLTVGNTTGSITVVNNTCDTNHILGNFLVEGAVVDAGTGTELTRAAWDNT